MVASFGLLKFFPSSDPLTRAALMDQISQFAPTAEQISWLTDTILANYS